MKQLKLYIQSLYLFCKTLNWQNLVRRSMVISVLSGVFLLLTVYGQNCGDPARFANNTTANKIKFIEPSPTKSFLNRCSSTFVVETPTAVQSEVTVGLSEAGGFGNFYEDYLCLTVQGF